VVASRIKTKVNVLLVSLENTFPELAALNVIMDHIQFTAYRYLVRVVYLDDLQLGQDKRNVKIALLEDITR
jgi:hypothetical protein